MKIMRIIIFSIILIMGMSCAGRKTAIDVQDFISIMEGEGFTVIDTTEQYDSSLIRQSFTAIDGTISVELIITPSNPDANQLYNQNKDRAELRKGGNASSQSSISFGNKAKFTLNSSGVYYVISKIDNTMLYIEVNSTNKKNVDEIVKKLGY